MKITKVYSTTSFHVWGWITSSLPFFGFIACVLISITYHFEQATRTHCGVWNFLPSISAAVGDSTPERYIWRFCIAYHGLPRMVICSFYWVHYRDMALKIGPSFYNIAFRIAVLLNVIENLSLVLLTFISSRENYNIHERSFITFMACATFYMILTIYCQNKIRTVVGFDAPQMKAFKMKIFAFSTNISMFILSIYLFVRHNRYCEPGVYSWYSACEYYIVFSNILFHSSAMVEFDNLQVIVADVDRPAWTDKKPISSAQQIDSKAS